MRRSIWLAAAVVAACAVGLTVWAQLRPPGEPATVRANVVATYPHDPRAFTQGLAFHEGRLFESTGQYGQSSIRRVDLETGAVAQIEPLNFTYFGEGMTVLGDKLYQLTWKSQLAFVYDVETFELLETKRYRGEGWGLTHDGESLIVSNGSAELAFYDPDDFSVRRTIEVLDGEAPVARLNELEFIDGEIWANVWYDDRIVRVSPQDGAVVGWVDLSDLVPRTRRTSDDVLNGIAYDAEAGRVFVTGKNWPSLFEIELAR